MKKFLNKIYYSLLFSFVFIFIFSFFVFGLTPNAPLKVNADSNLDSVGLHYSSDWSSDAPDYNKVIMNNDLFLGGNNLKNTTFDFSIKFRKQDNYDNVLISEYVFIPNDNNGIDSLEVALNDYFNSNRDRFKLLFSCNDFTIFTHNIYFNILKYSDSIFIQLLSRSTDIYINNNLYANNFKVTLVDGYYIFDFMNVPFSNGNSSVNIDFHFFQGGSQFSGINNIRDLYVSRTFVSSDINFNYDIFNYYYFNYGTLKVNYNSYHFGGVFNGGNFNLKSNIGNIVSVSAPDGFSDYGWTASTGLILFNYTMSYPDGTWTYVKNTDSSNYLSFNLVFNYVSPSYLYNSYSSNNSNYNATDLYKQDVQWYDIFGHLYNFVIYLIFDMPLLSNITKPIYFAIDSFVTTLNWANGIVLGLGIFGAFAMVYLTFAIIKRFL